MRNHSNQFRGWTAGFAIPVNWRDESWGNDVCPSFVVSGLKVWVDFEDPEDRELGSDVPRFAFYALDGYGEQVGAGPLFECETFEEAARFLASRTVQS